MKKIKKILCATIIIIGSLTSICFADQATCKRYVNDLTKVNNDLKILSNLLVDSCDSDCKKSKENIKYLIRETDSLQKNITNSYYATDDEREKETILYLLYVNTIYSISVKEASFYLDDLNDINHLIKMLSSQRTGDITLSNIKNRK